MERKDGGEGSGDTANQSMDMKDGDIGVVQGPEDSASADISKKSCFSTHFFTTLVKDFGKTQQTLVRNSGFSFVLDVPNYRTEIRLAAMLLLCYDPETDQLRLDDGSEHRLTKNDITNIMGLAQGHPFQVDVNTPEMKSNIAKLARMFPRKVRKPRTSPTSSISVTRARERLIQLKSCTELSEEQQEEFMAALVICTVVHFISPSKRTKDIEPEVVAAISTEDGTLLYDWADFALSAIREAAKQFKNDLLATDSTKQINVPGCTLLLVVFYIMKFTDCGIQYVTSRKKPLLQSLEAGDIRYLLKRDEDRRLLMPTYILLSSKTKIDTKLLRAYDMARSTGAIVQDIARGELYVGYNHNEHATTQEISAFINNEWNKMLNIIQTRLSELHSTLKTEYMGTTRLHTLLGDLATQSLKRAYLQWAPNGFILRPPTLKKETIVNTDNQRDAWDPDHEKEMDAADGLMILCQDGEESSAKKTDEETVSPPSMRQDMKTKRPTDAEEDWQDDFKFTVAKKMRTPRQRDQVGQTGWTTPKFDVTPSTITVKGRTTPEPLPKYDESPSTEA